MPTHRATSLRLTEPVGGEIVHQRRPARFPVIGRSPVARAFHSPAPLSIQLGQPVSRRLDQCQRLVELPVPAAAAMTSAGQLSPSAELGPVIGADGFLDSACQPEPSQEMPSLSI